MTARPARLTALLAAGLLAALTACSSAAVGPDPSPTASSDAQAPELRLGYFANLTHAVALVGVDDGTYQESLGDTQLTTQIFNAGPAAVEALFGGAIDATFIGPNPAINAFAQSDGDAVRIVSGATSGGAQLVVRDGIDSPDDLVGTTLATPQLGNTQDVALRAWLADQGLETSLTGGASDVTIAPQENSQTLDLLKAGELDGAWLPEPWASRLVVDAGAHVLLDEKELWPDGDFVTTHLIVSTEYLSTYPGTVKKLLEAQLATSEWIAANPDEAKTRSNAVIEELSGKPLSPQVLDRAWSNLRITLDPVATSLQTSADHAVAAGTSKETDLRGIYDLTLLNEVLAEHGQEPVADGGLGASGT
ncbi:ABC transporter substrate-binding protein [Cellulomonas fengjieae]|uniref:ABC transporter substrate-binding protein n=1 Tax=Cellulomonas fengjieae TaxID=2819978 RepID=A0ABS3SJ82_9CELL|nr:ABC transporter substrate-binding protein [Cellulomonas fengjieae]MBO3085807.1 ABC transporter substrate-binding protein [Cellulomonas fengjieae]QVI67490.1 ABC transporter substrate-binding protein [Cellulomonas fengjieae]